MYLKNNHITDTAITVTTPTTLTTTTTMSTNHGDKIPQNKSSINKMTFIRFIITFQLTFLLIALTSLATT